MKKSRRTYNGVHLNKKSNTQDVVEQSLTIIFDRAYNDYHCLYKKHVMESFFIVRAKTNTKAKVLKWK